MFVIRRVHHPDRHAPPGPSPTHDRIHVPNRGDHQLERAHTALQPMLRVVLYRLREDAPYTVLQDYKPGIGSKHSLHLESYVLRGGTSRIREYEHLPVRRCGLVDPVALQTGVETGQDVLYIYGGDGPLVHNLLLLCEPFNWRVREIAQLPRA